MCIRCEIDDALIDMAAKNHVRVTLDGEPVSVGQMESMLLVNGELDNRLMVSLTDAGRVWAEMNA